MDNRYSRNRIYLTPKEQEVIKDIPILIGGGGLGSVIAECALRLGFENLTIVDGEEVNISNLNSQNYTALDLDSDKAQSIKTRLKVINENAKITVHNCLINVDNVEEIVQGHEIAINTLDFAANAPLEFDRVCQEKNIPIIHPYNLGWGGLVTVIKSDGISMQDIKRPDENFDDLNVFKYANGYLKFWGNHQSWMDDILTQYKAQTDNLPLPQLSIASWTVAAMCTHLLFNIATHKDFKQFPQFYLSSILDK